MSDPDPNRLAFRTIGAGDPVIVINGYAATKDDWDPAFLEALGTSSRLICPDNRGIGTSPEIHGGLTIAAMANDVIELIDALGLGRCDLVGWSMGGFVAQQAATLASERIGRLVLLSTDHGGPGAITADPATWARLIDHGGTPREQATRLLGLLFGPDQAPAIDAEFGELVARARARLSIDALAAQEHAIDRWHAEPADARLASIAAPTLIVAGDRDAVVPAINGRLLADALPGARYEVFAGCGHAVMAQEPLRLAQLINSWLGR